MSATRRNREEHRLLQRKVNEGFADFLRAARRENGLSQVALSIHLARGPKYIWRIENGYTEVDLFEFIEIVEALGKDPTIAIGKLYEESFLG